MRVECQYVGISSNVEERLQSHNQALTATHSTTGPGEWSCHWSSRTRPRPCDSNVMSSPDRAVGSRSDTLRVRCPSESNDGGLRTLTNAARHVALLRPRRPAALAMLRSLVLSKNAPSGREFSSQYAAIRGDTCARRCCAYAVSAATTSSAAYPMLFAVQTDARLSISTMRSRCRRVATRQSVVSSDSR
jgi:hypothetical protein